MKVLSLKRTLLLQILSQCEHSLYTTVGITFNLAHLSVERPLLVVRREKFLKEINLKINPRLMIHFLSTFLNPFPTQCTMS